MSKFKRGISKVLQYVQSGLAATEEIASVENLRDGWRAMLAIAVLVALRIEASTDTDGTGMMPVTVCPASLAGELGVRPRLIVEAIDDLVRVGCVFPRTFCRRGHLEKEEHAFYVGRVTAIPFDDALSIPDEEDDLLAFVRNPFG